MGPLWWKGQPHAHLEGRLSLHLKGTSAYTDLVPVLTDVADLRRVVRVALGFETRASEIAFSEPYRQAGQQIRHPEVRALKDFTGRDDMLKALGDKLWEGKSTVAIRNSSETTLALRGLGGVGKTVLAQTYAWQNRERYHGVWWVRADNRDTLIDDLVALGKRFIPGLEAQEPEDAAQTTLDRIAQMRTDKPWLLVYDNVDDQATIRRLTPPDNAHVLITTRLTEWHGEADELPVDVFDRRTAIDFLLAHARNKDQQRDAAGRLADTLHCLPLALSHARSYCGGRNWSFDEYVARLPDLIKRKPKKADYPDTVFATFSLAIEKAAEECAEAEKLMGLLAFLAPDQVPLWLIPEDVLTQDRVCSPARAGGHARPTDRGGDEVGSRGSGDTSRQCGLRRPRYLRRAAKEHLPAPPCLGRPGPRSTRRSGRKRHVLGAVADG
jgi:hypothetical protein